MDGKLYASTQIKAYTAADFYLSYFSYARPSAVHCPMRDGEGS